MRNKNNTYGFDDWLLIDLMGSCSRPRNLERTLRGLASMAGLELDRNRLQRQPNHAASEDLRLFLVLSLIHVCTYDVRVCIYIHAHTTLVREYAYAILSASCQLTSRPHRAHLPGCRCHKHGIRSRGTNRGAHCWLGLSGGGRAGSERSAPALEERLHHGPIRESVLHSPYSSPRAASWRSLCKLVGNHILLLPYTYMYFTHFLLACR